MGLRAHPHPVLTSSYGMAQTTSLLPIRSPSEVPRGCGFWGDTFQPCPDTVPLAGQSAGCGWPVGGTEPSQVSGRVRDPLGGSGHTGSILSPPCQDVWGCRRRRGRQGPSTGRLASGDSRRQGEIRAPHDSWKFLVFFLIPLQSQDSIPDQLTVNSLQKAGIYRCF